MAKHWIQGSIKHPGTLREALHVKEGSTIPAKKLVAAENSKNPSIAREARLAETLHRMHHGK